VRGCPYRRRLIDGGSDRLPKDMAVGLVESWFGKMRATALVRRGFLAAIRAQPTDATSRPCLRDWLDDRDDPRASLIRLGKRPASGVAWDDALWR